jgi:predicted Zn finger-like uncharacterized protein
MKMRLVCPKCDARYEVPEENIPTTGRDVQCSACDTTWFQKHPQMEAEQRSEAPQATENQGAAKADVTLAKPDDPQTQVQNSTDPKESQASSESAPDTKKADPNRQENQVKQRLHPTVAEVLREEARRETEARAAETLEMQTELGLDGGAQFFAPRREASENAQTYEQAETVSAAKPEAKTLEEELDELEAILGKNTQESRPPKSALLPNIEDINPSIEAEETADEVHEARDAPLPKQPKKRTGTFGFITGLLVIGLLFAIYHFEERIVQFHEPLAPALKSYVEHVDRIRAYSDHSVHKAIAWLEFQAERAREGASQD